MNNDKDDPPLKNIYSYLFSHFLTTGGGIDLATAVGYAKNASVNKLSTDTSPVTSIKTLGNAVGTSTVTSAISTASVLPSTQINQIPKASVKSVPSGRLPMSIGLTRTNTATNDVGSARLPMSIGITKPNTANNYVDVKPNVTNLAQQGKI